MKKPIYLLQHYSDITQRVILLGLFDTKEEAREAFKAFYDKNQNQGRHWFTKENHYYIDCEEVGSIRFKMEYGFLNNIPPYYDEEFEEIVYEMLD